MTDSSTATGRCVRTALWLVVLGAAVSGCSSATRTEPPPAASGTSRTVRLEQIRLPHQGVTGVGDDSDWVGAPWTYQPCGQDGALLAVDRAAQVRSIEQTGPEYGAVETAVLFADEPSALAFVRRIETAVAACDTPGPRVDTLTVAGDLPGAWTQGRVYHTSGRMSGGEGPQAPPTATAPEDWMGVRYLLLARTGRVVMMVQQAGEFGPLLPTPLSDEVVAFRPPLDELARQVA